MSPCYDTRGSPFFEPYWLGIILYSEGTWVGRSATVRTPVAALVGFPIAGFLGSFFAVPMVAFAHVVAREVMRVRHGLSAEQGLTP